MQSQLEAALLGHSFGAGGTPEVASRAEDDGKDFQDCEGEDDFVDEECESETGHQVEKQNAPGSRNITLQMLLAAGILQPGNGTMSIEYLGQRFIGDLLEDGKIRSQETDLVFATPSAWAVACKRFIYPEKKSGCSWASIKYCGRKLDVYKTLWFNRKRREEEENRASFLREIEEQIEESNKTPPKDMAASLPPVQRVVVKHNTIANRTFTHDANTLIECVPFSNLGKIQPFLVSISTNAALLMDFHCHLSRSEVCGYLAGSWDVNSHNLQITHAFPCRNTKSDRENAPQVEAEISRAIEQEKLTLVGWYHSHAFFTAAPTLRDVDAQLDYQIRMKGASDNSYTPCIGIIISPYSYENTSPESSIIAYWVIPPPETKPNEYGRPMLMSYSVVQDATLGPSVRDEIARCADYYRLQQKEQRVDFAEKYGPSMTYVEKLGSSLSSKFPREENEAALWRFVRESVGFPADTEETDPLLSIPTPSVAKAPAVAPASASASAVGLNSNLMLTSDIASMLFNSGKFPSASSLLGLPDPMAHSTLAANNMFLSTNLFKMQELLKPPPPPPLSASKAKGEAKLKVPAEMKATGAKPDDYGALNMKNKLGYDAKPPKTPKSDLSCKSPKREYAVAASDFNVATLAASNYSLDLSKSAGYPSLAFAESFAAGFAEEAAASADDGDKPLNLAAD